MDFSEASRSSNENGLVDKHVQSFAISDSKDSNVAHYLHFAVKFYPMNPTNIKQDLTRYVRNIFLNRCPQFIGSFIGPYDLLMCTGRTYCKTPDKL